MANLLEVNVNEFTKDKNKMTYLSWAHAWKEVLKACPDATYKIIKNPETHMPYFKDDTGYFTFTEMTIDGITREMWLPVMDFSNKAKLSNVTVVEINKAVMRCLTKNIAMFGLGLYIYAGEDLPEEEVFVLTDLFKKQVDELNDLATLLEEGSRKRPEEEKAYIRKRYAEVKAIGSSIKGEA